MTMENICEKFFRGNKNRMYLYIVLAFVFMTTIIAYIFSRPFNPDVKLPFMSIIIGIALAVEYRNCMDAYKTYEEMKETEENKRAVINKAITRKKVIPCSKKYRPDSKAEQFVNVSVTEVSGPKQIKGAVTDFLKNKGKNPKKDPVKDPIKKPPTPTSDPKPIVKPGESKAEKEGNVIIDKNGKAVVKPNYTMIASEWVSANLNLLNKICNDAFAISGGNNSYVATIPKSMLPEEQATWVIIGKTLVAEDDIDSFQIGSDGISVTVK